MQVSTIIWFSVAVLSGVSLMAVGWWRPMLFRYYHRLNGNADAAYAEGYHTLGLYDEELISQGLSLRKQAFAVLVSASVLPVISIVLLIVSLGFGVYGLFIDGSFGPLVGWQLR